MTTPTDTREPETEHDRELRHEARCLIGRALACMAASRSTDPGGRYEDVLSKLDNLVRDLEDATP